MILLKQNENLKQDIVEYSYQFESKNNIIKQIDNVKDELEEKYKRLSQKNLNQITKISKNQIEISDLNQMVNKLKSDLDNNIKKYSLHKIMSSY